ncbi:hypothetical protein [Phenylobacterium sp.]|jgi:putative copper export protein|uniref:hypothetical protein n=1 Tax=Phenylobacterium sp. TaxID=1871053 RepID=UPI002E36D802|nr:hypothetical protein [Phenylobacterium sp.]HEX3366088.1 hypothetical protein [Phenylobacterium sp.]
MIYVNYILQYAHVVCAAFWFGTVLYTELVLWPRLRRMGELERVQGELRNTEVRKIVGLFVVGTVVTGVARGVANGLLPRLYTPYGVCFVAGALVGIWMMTWWLCFPPRSMKLGWRTFYSSFWVVLALMFGMRFSA